MLPLATFVDDVAQLWKQEILAIVFVLLIVYRKPIGRAIDRLTNLRLRRGHTELETTHTEPTLNASEAGAGEADQDVQDGEQALSNSAEIREVTAEAAEPTRLAEESTDVEQLKGELMAAALDKQWDDAKRIFDRLQDSIEDPAEREEERAYYAFVRHNLSDDTKAFAELVECTKDPAIAASAWYWVGLSHKFGRDHQAAAEAFNRAVELAGTDSERARSLIEEALALWHVSEKEEAFELVTSALEKEDKVGIQARYYDALAQLYQLDGKLDLGAIALEKVLESQPNNATARFDAAYAYSDGEKKASQLSALHYKRLIDVDPKHAMAHNNLGVQYERMDMPLKSVDEYERSAELDNSLAMANLASKLLYVGFQAQAEELVTRGNRTKRPHKNLASVQTTLAERRDKDNAAEKEALQQAAEQQRFFRQFATRFFCAASRSESFAGRWTWQDGTAIEIVCEGKELEADWSTPEGGKEVKHKITGTVEGSGALIDRWKMGYRIFSDEETDFTKVGEGYAYSAGTTVKTLLYRDGKPEFDVLTRAG